MIARLGLVTLALGITVGCFGPGDRADGCFTDDAVDVEDESVGVFDLAPFAELDTVSGAAEVALTDGDGAEVAGTLTFTRRGVGERLQAVDEEVARSAGPGTICLDHYDVSMDVALELDDGTALEAIAQVEIRSDGSVGIFVSNLPVDALVTSRDLADPDSGGDPTSVYLDVEDAAGDWVVEVSLGYGDDGTRTLLSGGSL